MKWSRSKPEVEFQYGKRLFSLNRKYLYLSRELSYVDEIWFADRFWPSEDSDINKQESGSSIGPPRQPSWKIDMISYFRSGWTDLEEIRQADQWHADFGEMVQNETGSRILIWRTFVFFQTGSTYISAMNWAMSTKVGLQTDFDLLKTATSTDGKAEQSDAQWHADFGEMVENETGSKSPI